MADLSELSKIITDSQRVLFGSDIPVEYLSDTLGRKKGEAGALVYAASTEDVSAVLSFADKNLIPVTPRGAGTNLVGSTVPQKGGIIIDLSRMNRVLELDEENLTAWVEPGIRLCDFQKFVEEKGLFYPPDPGEKTASIGGNIATNAGGMRAVKYGVTRNYVMALELVLADGTVITAGGKNRKDTTGLDIKDIVIGSEGTLAVITKCLLKLIAKPEFSRSVLVSFDSLKTGIETVPKLLKASLNPTALEFIERKVIQLGEDFLKLEFPLKNYEACLLLSFDGSESEVKGNIEKLKHVAASLNGGSSVLSLDDSELSASVWKIRGALVKAVEAVSEQEPLDIVVPIARISDFVEFVNQLEKEWGLPMISFGHAGDGNVHLCVVRGKLNDSDWEQKLDEALEKLYGKARELGGLISGEHGLGLSKRKYFFAQADNRNVSLMNAVKSAFDRNRILNGHISYCI